MTTYFAYCAGGEFGIQASVPLVVATTMGRAAHIIIVGPVVSLMLLVVLMHSGDVLLIYLHFDLLAGERCVPLKDWCINWCERCTLQILCFARWWCVLKSGIRWIADEVFTVIIILERSHVMMASGCGTTCGQLIFAICELDVAGGGLGSWHVCRYGIVIAHNTVGRVR